MPIYLHPASTRGRRNPAFHARRNMAVRFGGAEWDTWDEVPEPIKQKILAGETGAAPPTRTRKTSRRARKTTRAASTPTKRHHKPIQDVYAKIAKSIGGWRVMVQLCPSIERYKKPTKAAPGKYAFAFQMMQLDPRKAAVVAQVMEEAGVLVHGQGKHYRKGPEAQAIARRILLEYGGISCPP